MSNVLVMFQADTERTEQIALAVGVGAVEAEANIRLRRLAAPGAVEVAHKGYGKLQKADLLWANTVVVGLESSTPKAAELEDLLVTLRGIDPKELVETQVWTFNSDGLTSDRSEAQNFVESALQVAGMIVVPMNLRIGPGATDLLARMKQAGRLSARLAT